MAAAPGSPGPDSPPSTTRLSASRTVTRPDAPASTTPAVRSAASWVGVRSRAARAAVTAASTTALRVACACRARASAASAALRATVRIVPSVGSPTQS